MPAPVPNSADALCAEILAQARRESADIIQRGKSNADAMVAAAKVEADKIRLEGRQQAQATAARQKELLLAAMAVEAARLRSDRVEALLEAIRERIRQRLLARDVDTQETAIALAVEAIRQMPGSNFILKLSAADVSAFGARLADEISRRLGGSTLQLAVYPDSDNTVGGVVVQDADGLRIWDNRLLARLERLWPELRRQIAARTSLVAQNETSKNPANSATKTAFETFAHSCLHPAVPSPSVGRFKTVPEASEDCNQSKPVGGWDNSEKGVA